MAIINIRNLLNLDPAVRTSGDQYQHQPLNRQAATAQPDQPTMAIDDKIAHTKAAILSDLAQQAKDLHIERNKLSNQYHHLESRKAPLSAFQENYAEIEELTAKLQRNYELKNYALRYGKLPDRYTAIQDHSKDMSLAELKEQRRSINNRKHKHKSKLKLVAKYPEGSPEQIKIQLQIDMLEAEQFLINEKISKIENDY